ncbi:hypothetical protein Q4E93_26475 [Flavitalea sp. BT771]|uniref:hypothetical protein n=1 Tax=Flavitalea sp. BT771 TaxID=3063329 RepID=UPI0026E289C6|nr:hypothetical protein [Flavitalea sp. BT771]MDO6434183.1 hypothetical protein [Flavitalea sp. BT771]MDV6223083.1 hypothetical protein [Flavitalea sp. BT771]
MARRSSYIITISLYLFTILLLITFLGCTDKAEKKCAYTYRDADNYYCVEGKLNSGIEDNVFIFYEKNDAMPFKESGFYNEGFRNGLWSYNVGGNLKTIKWGHYKDKNLRFETNVFEHIDTIKYGDVLTGFEFTTTEGNLSLIIAVNDAMKDSLRKKDYRTEIENEFREEKYQMTEYNFTKLNSENREIGIARLAAKKRNGKMFYMWTAYSFLDSGLFVQYSVLSERKENAFQSILFNSILTNLFIGGKRFYNPFKQEISKN